jgi:streptogrisin B
MSIHKLRQLLATVAAALLLVSGLTFATPAPAAAGGTIAALPPVGSAICHAGPVSGLRCGTLAAVNVTVIFPGGQVVTGLFRYTACAEPGDGGAPIFDLRTGQQIGTVVAATGNCSIGGQTFGLPL